MNCKYLSWTFSQFNCKNSSRRVFDLLSNCKQNLMHLFSDAWRRNFNLFINIYNLFVPWIYHIVSLQFVGGLEFCLWRWHMTFSDTEMKELGKSTQINIPNTRSLICSLRVCIRHLADRRSLHGGRKRTHGRNNFF